MNTIIRHIRLAALGVHSDSELLDRFVNTRDETAFAALIKRHGPMVLGVCRRVLRNEHDAEDSFQATFLVLVRKAGSIRSRASVGSWLHEVAMRTALKAKSMKEKRQDKERQAFKQPLSPAGEGWEELLPILDQELSRLPDKYRAPIVLCDLEGRSRTEAARLLGCPVGSLSWRLSEARRMLAAKLARYAPVASAGAITGLLTQNAPAFVPASLVAATTKAAIVISAGPVVAGMVSGKILTLTEGVVKMMLLAKLKTVSAVCIGLTALGLSTGGLVYQTRAGTGDDQKLEQTQADRPKGKSRAEPKDPQRELAERDARIKQLEEQLRRALDKLKEYQQFKQAREEERRLIEEMNKRNRAIILDERSVIERQSVRQEKARLESGYQQQREELLRQLERLDRQHQVRLMELEIADAGLPAQQKPNPPDKLDQILQRLGQIEGRLQRLESRPTRKE